MAKVAFSKLALKKQDEVKTIKIGDIDIEVKQYLPIMDKLLLITRVINEAADDNNFVNPVKNELFGALEIVMTYTNISFTDKQKEDPAKLYDILEQNDIIDLVSAAIPPEEYSFIVKGINECSEAVYKYRNSVLGVLDSLKTDYNNMELEADEIQAKLQNKEGLEFLQDVLTKMG